MSKVFTMSFASVYTLYRAKVEKKGRTQAELDEVIRWLTGFDDAELAAHLAARTTFEAFFAAARLHPNHTLITGVVCGGEGGRHGAGRCAGSAAPTPRV